MTFMRIYYIAQIPQSIKCAESTVQQSVKQTRHQVLHEHVQRHFLRTYFNKKHWKNVGPIRHCEPFYIAIHQVSLLSHATTVARCLRIDVHDNDDNNNNDNDNVTEGTAMAP